MSNEKKKSPAKSLQQDIWRFHDIYKIGFSFSRIITRSQTAFNRIKNSDSDTNLFSDKQFHRPKSKAHLISTMKGKYGAIPRTKITRSTSRHFKVTKKLSDELDDYKLRMDHKKVIMQLEESFKDPKKQKYLDEINEAEDFYAAQLRRQAVADVKKEVKNSPDETAKSEEQKLKLAIESPKLG